MFKGKTHSEALNDPTIINDFNIVEFRIEHHPEANTKFWHFFKVKIPDNEIKSMTKRLSKEMKHGWFSIFWNEDEIVVVFPNRVFNLPREKSLNFDKWKEAIDYGIKNGIQKEYLNFEKEIDF